MTLIIKLHETPMKKIYFISVLLFGPLVSYAHAEELHSAWYQEPMTVLTILAAVLALGALCYGLFTKRKNFIVLPAIALVAVAVVGVVTFGQTTDTNEAQLAVANFGTGQSVTLYKSPNCGCCSGHAAALEAAGFDVTIEETHELDSIKQANNIPAGGASCHTSVIGEYVVEGHVPLEAIEKLLAEQPDIAGIGLPGMPSGTPGMPGPKTAPYEVYQLSSTGEMSPYLTI